MKRSITKKIQITSVMYIFIVMLLSWITPITAYAAPSFCNAASPDYIGAAQIPFDNDASLIPIWSEILQNNVGTIQAGEGNGSGVPDLDRLGDELLFSESIGNVIHLLNNYLKAKVGPSIAANLMDPSQVGIGMCQIGPNEYRSTTRITYCDHSISCSGGSTSFSHTPVLWLPQAGSVFNDLTVDIRLPQDMVDDIEMAVDNSPLSITFDPNEPLTISLFDILIKGPSAMVEEIVTNIQGVTIDTIIPQSLLDEMPDGLTILPALEDIPLGDYLAEPFQAIADELDQNPINSNHPDWPNFLAAARALQVTDSAESITVKHSLPANFAEARKKWADKQLAKLGDLTSDELTETFENILSVAGSVIKGAGKFQEMVEAFENTLTTYGEGFHLGAYDEQRPTLHQCVGFYGSGVNSQLASFNIGSLGVNIGSSYFSEEISKNYVAQARFGTTQLTIGNRTLPLNASASIHTQIDGLKNFDCEVPFGIDLAGKFGTNLCPNYTGFSGPQLCTANTENSYVAIDNNTSGSTAGGTAGIKDYYPVKIDGEVVWPRFDPAGDLNYPSTAIVAGDAPSHASVSVGLNASFDSGFNPSPKLIRTIPISPPLQAALYMQLDWGLHWFHDSMHVRDILADNIAANDINIDEIFSRDMHPMQAEDVTTEDGVGYYLSPAIIVAAGLIYNIPQNKPRVIFNLSADLGLYVDLSTEFSGGIADTGQVIQDILQNSSSDPDLICEPIMETNVVGEKCDGNFYEKDTPELLMANELIDVVYQDSTIKAAQPSNIQNTMTVNDYISEVDIALITNNSNITPYMYSCDGESIFKAIILDEAERPVIEIKTNDEGEEYETVTFYELKGRSCADYGFCSFSEETPTGEIVQTDQYGISQKDCTGKTQSVYSSYQCNPIMDREITGWTGNGCSPLLSDAPYPTAPGGECSAASGVSNCASGFACQDGACLTQCNSTSDCADGESCSVDGLCELDSGLPYAEQIPWRASHPDTLRPYHAVWSHAISKAEANADFGLGLNVNVGIRLFRRTFTLVDGRIEKFWNLGNWPIVKYQSGLEAPYNNSCVAGGVMKNHQLTAPSSPVGVKRPDPNSSGNLIDVVTGQTTTEEFIDLCNEQLGDNAVDPNLPLADQVVEEGTNSGVDFSEDVALDLWETNNENMCVNGMPWEDWLNSVSEGATNNDLPFSINDGSDYYPINGSLNVALLNASGCLTIGNIPVGNIFSSNNLQDIVPMIGNNIDISAMLIDVNGEISIENFKPEYTNNAQFSQWMLNLENCMESYLNANEFSLTEVTFGACGDNPNRDTDNDGVPDVKDNCPFISNKEQLDSDNDGVGNACDNCPNVANADQLDADNNGIGDACPVIENDWNVWFEELNSLEGVDIVIVNGDDEGDDNNNNGGIVIGNTVTVSSVLDEIIKLPSINIGDNSTVVIDSGTFEVAGDIRISHGTLEIKKGSFTIEGSLLIQKSEATTLEPAQASTGQLVIKTEGAILHVNKNLIINTTQSGESLLTQGTINVGGDVIQTCSESSTTQCKSNFIASNNNTLNLTADKKHYVSFDTPESSTINNLTLASNSTTEFATKVTVKGNIELSGAKITLAEGVTIAGIENDKDGDGIADSEDNCPNIANSNQNASACQTVTPPTTEETKSGGAINVFVMIFMALVMLLKKATKLKRLLWNILFITATIATAHATAANNQTTQIKAQNLAKHLAQTLHIKIYNVTDSPINGLFEVTSEKGVFYSTVNGDYFIHGSMTDVNNNFKNLTLDTQNKLRIDRIESLSNSMISFPAEQESHVITVFTDVNCGYCRKLHSQIAEYNQLGITVRYLAFPRQGVGSKTWQVMQSLWCSDDKAHAMNTLKAGNQITTQSCDNAVASHYKLGRDLQITGTPAIILENGKILPGFKPPKQLLAMITKNQP